jgi:CelD/BcsL family acetyltransferase involved in cellulose biosynthesis
MHLDTVTNVEDFTKLAEEWNALLKCCNASHVPFLRHEYLITWWDTLGGGEWPHGELNIITARGSNGHLVGIAPLFYTQNLDGNPAYMLIGSIEISDYLDLIVGVQDMDSFVSCLLEHLAKDSRHDWGVLDLYNLPEDSPTLPALEAAAVKMGLDFSQEKLQPCPYIPLPGDWEAYLLSLKKKQRHEIRRKIRRAEDNPETVRWYIVEDEDHLEGEIEHLFALMAQDPAKEEFLTEKMRQQMNACIRAAFDAGWLQLIFLEVGGNKAAVYLNFDYAGHIWLYNSGFDFEYGDLSPGWVLLGYLLQWANENGRQALDFMRGDEKYKYRFGGVNRYVVRAKITNKPD